MQTRRSPGQRKDPQSKEKRSLSSDGGANWAISFEFGGGAVIWTNPRASLTHEGAGDSHWDLPFGIPF